MGDGNTSPAFIGQNEDAADTTTARWCHLERNYICSRPRLLIKAAFSSPLEQEKGHRDSQATLDSGTARADVRVLGLVMKPQIRDDGKPRQERVSGGWLVPSCHSGKWAPWVCCRGGQGCRARPGRLRAARGPHVTFQTRRASRGRPSPRHSHEDAAWAGGQSSSRTAWISECTARSQTEDGLSPDQALRQLQ